ncbi:recombinase family protein [Nocardioides dongxiaopingii]|uniref:recombinase family protein n=1 Tax=Nocardioides dongxiaopingii TaxID=2576036 RepID=UPI001BAF049B|nr:recombinase family protein [Nocardioides dongxiaopingii]
MPNTPQCAAIYARISQDSEGTAAGVGRQVEDCHKMAASLGWTVAGEYVDNDISAYSGKRRPEYERLLDDLTHGEVDAVLVYHLDRLTRRPIELEQFLAVIDTAKVRHVRFVAGHSDITTGDGLLVVRMLAAVAANESASKSRRVARKQQQNAEEGKPHRGSIRPYGYRSDFTTVDPTEAEVFRAMAQRVLAGESTRSVATWLNDNDHPTVTGARWRSGTIRTMLLNPRYAGLRAHRGQVVGPGLWEAIIDEATHRKIKAAFAERASSGRRAPQRYLLSGLLRCGRCGNRLFSSPRADRRRYVCLSGPDHGGCGRLTVTAPPLEAILAEAVLYRLDSPELADAMTGRTSTDQRTRALSAELDTLTDRRDELSKAYGDGLITMPEWLTARRPIESGIEQTTRALARLTNTSALTGLVGTGNELRTAWNTLNLDRQHAIVKAVLDHAVIAPGRAGVHTVELERVQPLWQN